MTTTEEVLASSRAQLDKAHRKIVKDIQLHVLIEELGGRGFDVLRKQDPPEPHVDFEPLPGPPAAGYAGDPVHLPTTDVLWPWTPEEDRRPPTGPRFGMTREVNRYLGSARRGECTNCLKHDNKISAAAWRLSASTGTTIRSLCVACADKLVDGLNATWHSARTSGSIALPDLEPKRVLEIPTFATAEEALAWLDEHSA